jgi:hypothetical protein
VSSLTKPLQEDDNLLRLSEAEDGGGIPRISDLVENPLNREWLNINGNGNGNADPAGLEKGRRPLSTGPQSSSTEKLRSSSAESIDLNKHAVLDNIMDQIHAQYNAERESASSSASAAAVALDVSNHSREKKSRQLSIVFRDGNNATNEASSEMNTSAMEAISISGSGMTLSRTLLHDQGKVCACGDDCSFTTMMMTLPHCKR